MAHINIPKIVAQDVSSRVLIAFFGGWPLYEIRDVGYNFCPLDKTWYEEEVDTERTKTIRFAKRSDHTGILIKLDKDGFSDGFIDIP